MHPNPPGASSLASQAPTPRSGGAYNTQPASLSTSGEQTAVNTATTSTKTKSSTGSGGGPFRDLPQVVAVAVAAAAAGDPAVLRGDKAHRSTSAFDMV